MSFLSSITGPITGAIGGFLAGGPVGGVLGALGGISAKPGTQVATAPFGGPIGSAVQGATQFFNNVDKYGFAGFGPGKPPFTAAAPPFGAHGFGGKRMAPVNGRCPSGYHPAKDGRGCVRNRHMNFGNGRATARSIRRIRGAEKQFSHIFSMTHRKTGVRIKRKR